jgi:ABC-type dipeptide/oligopeptide/nickel transport system permease subunit
MGYGNTLQNALKNLGLRAFHKIRKQKWVIAKIVRNPSAMVGAFIVALMIISAVFAPWIAPHDPLKTDIEHRFEGPSAHYLLGTDELGRDTLARIIYGARTTVPIIFGVVVLGAAIGVLLGILAGYYSGTFLDKLLLWIFDVISTFPGIILVLALVAIFGSSDLVLTLILAFWRIPSYGRISRTEILSIKNETYVKAAEALGARRWRIILSHMLPNSLPPIIVLGGMDLGVVVMSIAGLSYLGLGMQPPKPSWGGMLSIGYTYIRQSPWLIIWGCVTLVIIMIGCSLFSGGLRASLKPEESLSE